MLQKIKTVLIIVVCMYVTARFPSLVITTCEAGFRVGVKATATVVSIAREKVSNGSMQ